MKRWLPIAIGLALVGRLACDERREPVRFATFNIKNFPQDARQIDGAFREIASLEVGFVAVQEIGEPEVFAREAARRLGPSWELASVDSRPVGERRPGHHIGVLFDRRRWTFVESRVHDETRVGGRYKPTLEVALRARDAQGPLGGATIRVLVVHFKSGAAARPIRSHQFAAVAAIVSRVKRAGDPVVLLGDFNATEPADFDDLADLAGSTRMTWATEGLACSAFWSRSDGCPRSRLDHVLTWAPPSSVRAAGACATHGCDWEQSCPLYAREVSDHCPVVLRFE